MNGVKRIIAFIVFLALMLQGTALGFEGKLSYGELSFESRGITVNYICRAVSSYEDGHGIIVTAVEGADETLLEVVDVETEELIHVFHTGIAGTMWYGAADSDGRVFCAIGRSLVIYSPEDKTVTNAGYVPTTLSGNSNSVIAPFPGTAFGTTSAYGYVYACRDNKISILTQLPGVSSMGGIAYNNGFLYSGGRYSGADCASSYLYKINPDTGEPAALSNPLGENISGVGFVHSCGKYIIAQLTGYSGVTHGYFYDTEDGCWLDKTVDFDSNGMTDECDGKLFYISNGSYYGIDTQTLEVTKYPSLNWNFQRGNGLPLTCSYFPGECFVQSQYNGNLYVVSPALGACRRINVSLEEASMRRRISRVGTDGSVYVTGFMGSSGASYNPQTKEKKAFSIGQGEGAVCYGNKMYIGVYPGALIYELDMTKGYDKSNPKLVYDIGDDQDRPFGMDICEGKLVVGTLPSAGKTGGALTVIDLDTYSGETYRNIIPEQSVLTVTHKGSVVYFGTSASGGAGAVAENDRQAHVVSFDMNTRKIIGNVKFSVPGVNKTVGAVHGLKYSPDDDALYGSAGGILFRMRPDTLELENSNVYGGIEEITGSTTQLWHEHYMEFYDGFLLCGAQIADRNSLQIIDSAPTSAQLAGVIGSRAYFVDGNTDIYSAELMTDKSGGIIWSFDDRRSLPYEFTLNNKDIPRYLNEPGASGKNGDYAFGWLTGIGNGRGNAAIGQYSNGFNLLKNEIGEDLLNDTTIVVSMDFMVKNIEMTANLINPNFTARKDQFAAYVSMAGGRLYTNGTEIGSYGENEWHNVSAVYRLSSENGVSYDVYFDEKCAAENISVNTNVTRAGVSYFRILINADTSDEAYNISNRFDGRQEILYIDNLYIGQLEDNKGTAPSYRTDAEAVYINGGAYGTRADIIVPEYEGGRLTEVSVISTYAAPRTTEAVAAQSPGKCFVWTNLTDMKPLMCADAR